MKNFLKKLFLLNSIKKTIGLKNYEKIKNFLRFYGIHFFGYEVNENISFGSAVSNDFFEKELKSCKIYFEYGSGSTTLLAKKLNKNFFSIEGDKDFFRYMSKKISSEQLILKSLGIVKYFSIPIDMEFDVIIKIVIYMIIVRVIISKAKKKKNMKFNKREKSTPKTPSKQRGFRMEEKKVDRKNNINIGLKKFRDMSSKSDKPLSPEERMKRREKELENMNKR